MEGLHWCCSQISSYLRDEAVLFLGHIQRQTAQLGHMFLKDKQPREKVSTSQCHSTEALSVEASVLPLQG